MRLSRLAIGHLGLVMSALLALASTATATDTALVMGNINYGQCANSLPGAGQDVNNMSNALDSVGWNVVKEKNLTKQGMLDAIKNNIPPEDCCYIIYYAGHGDNTMAGQGALVGTDCNTISPMEFADCLGDAKDRTLVILDSCGSGAFAMAVEDMNNEPGFLTATDDLSCALRQPNGGIFTNALLDCACAGTGPNTVMAVDTCLDSSFGEQYWNGTLGSKVLGSGAIPKVPTMSEWQFLVMSLLLLTVGAVVLVRQRPQHVLASAAGDTPAVGYEGAEQVPLFDRALFTRAFAIGASIALLVSTGVLVFGPGMTLLDLVGTICVTLQGAYLVHFLFAASRASASAR